MKKVLFINTQKAQCGVHQYGLNIYNLLKESKNLDCHYSTIETIEELQSLQSSEKFDAVLFNFHISTTTAQFSPIKPKAVDAKTICIFHDMFQVATYQGGFYDSLIIGDPTIVDDDQNSVHGYGRVLFDCNSKYIDDGVLRVGSFGFNSPQKNYSHIVELVQRHYDDAEININIPPNNSVSSETPADISNSPYVRQIRDAVRKPGIRLNITFDFFDQNQMIEYLSKNTINIFPFTQLNDGSGISSSLDVALSCRRPFAISDCVLFKHVLAYKLPITINDNSIVDIISRGTSVLEPIYNDWSRESVLKRLEHLIGV